VKDLSDHTDRVTLLGAIARIVTCTVATIVVAAQLSE